MNDINQEIFEQFEIHGVKYEVAISKIFKPISIAIQVEASKATPYLLKSNQKIFNFPYELIGIFTYSQTNALAGFILQLDGKLYPNEFYSITTTDNFAILQLGTNTKGFYSTNANLWKYDFQVNLESNWKLSFYVYNTHTSAQYLYITLLGYEKYIKPLKQIG